MVVVVDRWSLFGVGHWLMFDCISKVHISIHMFSKGSPKLKWHLSASHISIKTIFHSRNFQHVFPISIVDKVSIFTNILWAAFFIKIVLRATLLCLPLHGRPQGRASPPPLENFCPPLEKKSADAHVPLYCFVKLKLT